MKTKPFFSGIKESRGKSQVNELVKKVNQYAIGPR